MSFVNDTVPPRSSGTMSLSGIRCVFCVVQQSLSHLHCQPCLAARCSLPLLLLSLLLTCRCVLLLSHSTTLLLGLGLSSTMMAKRMVIVAKGTLLIQYWLFCCHNAMPATTPPYTRRPALATAILYCRLSMR